MTDRTIVVVGAGLAGLRACEQLRAASWTEQIVVLGAERHLPYNRPPLTKTALAKGVDVTSLEYRRRPSTDDVDWRLGTSASSADLDSQSITLEDGTQVPYDGLVVATGVSARRLPLTAPLEWRHAIRTLDDAAALHPNLTPGANVVIIGAGFIGCEVAATARSLGCHVTVVEADTVPLRHAVGPLVGEMLQRRHQERGVTFHLGQMVSAIEGKGDAPSAVILGDGTRLPADVVVEAAGSQPNTSWLDGNGLDLTDGVLCDAAFRVLRTNGPVSNVVALGDVARWPVPLSGQAHRIEHWSIPGETASVAARSLVTCLDGRELADEAFNPVPSFWSDQYDLRLQSFGLPSRGLGDVRVLEGDLDGDSVVGYHDAGRLVGVLLVGMPARMMHYRTLIVDSAATAAQS